MDTGKIKALATGARIQLMDGVRASLERVLAPDSPESINERNRVNDLRNEAKDKEALVERVAYTWFNRLCALRLMDSRGYTPVPVVTPRSGETMPAILADARRGIFCADYPLKSADKQRITALVSGGTDSVNPLGEAYVILLLSACDYYAKPIPALFGSDPRSTNAMRLLAPTSLLAENSILQRIVEGMDDENCKEVEVMGWLYQFYIAERKDEVFAGFGNNVKAGPRELASATQLFTPHWIVRYLVENSLGRLWMLNYPDSDLINHMDYYIATKPNDNLLSIDSPEELTFLDPAMGSGHILIYAFDLLYYIYLEEGYRPAEIPSLILRNNLTGYEIDDRAAEIASFALAIKARERDADYFSHPVRPDIKVFESIQFDNFELQDAGLIAGYEKLLDTLLHLDEAGSLFKPAPEDVVLLEDASTNLSEREGIFAGYTLGNIESAADAVRQLIRQYSVVVANPPYMRVKNMSPWLSGWVKDNYPDEKADLCTCFINRNSTYTKSGGFTALITMESWMFLSSFESMRRKTLQDSGIISIAHFGPRAFEAIGGEVVSTAASVFTPNKTDSVLGVYSRLVDYANAAEKDAALLESIRNCDCAWRYERKDDGFAHLPGSIVAYWLSSATLATFKNGTPLSDLSNVCAGFQTGDIDAFLRCWWEVDTSRIENRMTSRNQAQASGSKWFPCKKGGAYQKWYGNTEWIANWENDGELMRQNSSAVIRNPDFYFKESVSWSKISGSGVSMRYYPSGWVFDQAGSSVFSDQDGFIYYIMALCNSTTAMKPLSALSPNFTIGVGEMKKLPVIVDEANYQCICDLARQCTELSKSLWVEREITRDYARHPVIIGTGLLSENVEWLRCDREERMRTICNYEEKLNRFFANAYGLMHEVECRVDAEPVADETTVIRSLISYAVDCMFGRYSLDQEGLILAGQDSSLEEYLATIPDPVFMPDEDGVLPVTEEEWFEDDIVTEFWRWLKVAFGEEHFDENLAYIEDTLGCKLREYFIKGRRSAFYDDHCKTYSVTGSGKRPIYWMFSSPKSSFNCLVYTHRYDDRTVSKILTDYVRELRRKLEAQARGLEVSDVARDRTRAAKYHDMIEELNDWERDVLYPMAQRHITIDLDDGVRHNYKLFPGALRRVTGLS